MGYLLSELGAPVMKEWFDSAFMDSRIDPDGDLVVELRIRVMVVPDPEKNLLKVFALFGVSSERRKIMEFCNRFNCRFMMCRAQVYDRDSDGDWIVTFDYDKFMVEGERVEPKQVVLLVRKFEEVVLGGINQVDEDGIF